MTSLNEIQKLFDRKDCNPNSGTIDNWDRSTIKYFLDLVARMRALIQEIEWEGDDEIDLCPNCGFSKTVGEGHNPECVLPGLLVETEMT